VDLLQTNGELLLQFRRLCPRASLFEFPAWWADQVRRLSRGDAYVQWSSLTKRQQHEQLLEQLRAIPGIARVA
jgi:hypothetical protein